MKSIFQFALLLVFSSALSAQTLLKPERVFDGSEMQNWVVAVKGSTIIYAGEEAKMPRITVEQTIRLDGMTLLPGLIEGHSHILLHPYNETSWNDQVLVESPAERAVRAANHARVSLMAGVTTMRDLGSEGAGYLDVGIKKSIEKGVIPGPRLLVAGPAIVATGSYGPKGFHEGVKVPLGAEVADGHDGITRVVRDQIGKGADFIKVYADYRWGPDGEAQPTFTEKELALMVNLAESSGRYVVAHASTVEGMRRATMAGVETIEHGDAGTKEIFDLMREKDVAFCPTLAAGDAILQYQGWKKGSEPDPERIKNKKESFRMALESGVKICFGGDVGVYPHGENVRELEMMVSYGMNPKDVLVSATSGNAAIFHLEEKIGAIKDGLLADLVAVEGNPLQEIERLREVRFVMKNGVVYVNKSN